MQRHNPDRWAQVLRLIDTNGGHFVARDLAEVFGVEDQAAHGYLNRMQARGMITATRVDSYKFWHLPGHVVAVKSERQKVLDVLAKRGGAGRVELCRALGKTSSAINSLMTDMKRAGLVDVCGRSRLAVWYVAGQAPKLPMARSVKPQQTRAPVGPVVVPAGLQVQRCPPWTHDKRFQLHPDARAQFRGEFSKLGPGRYLEVGA